MIRLFSACRS